MTQPPLNWQSFNEILMKKWDPIGVRFYPTAYDEYYRYAHELSDLCSAGVDLEEIIQYFYDVYDYMGLPPNDDKIKKVSQMIYDFSEGKTVLSEILKEEHRVINDVFIPNVFLMDRSLKESYILKLIEHKKSEKEFLHGYECLYALAQGILESLFVTKDRSEFLEKFFIYLEDFLESTHDEEIIYIFETTVFYPMVIFILESNNQDFFEKYIEERLGPTSKKIYDKLRGYNKN